MSSSLTMYEEMDALSTRMVEAARIGDWERLVMLEKTMADLRETLRTNDDPTGLNPAEREHQASLIRHILENCEEVHQLAEPWMEHARQLLGDAVSRNRLAHAYGLE